MYIIGKKNKLGRKTFWYFFITKNLFGLLFTGIILYLCYAIYRGPLLVPVGELLSKNISYISTGMVSSWFLMIALSIIIILMARTSVLYKQYSFVLHNHALHIKRGIFFIKEQIIPYPQITNVEIIRPYLYSFFGLVKLNIETGQEGDAPSSRSKKYVSQSASLFPPMDKGLATELAHELMRRAALQNGYQAEEVNVNQNSSTRRRRRR